MEGKIMPITEHGIKALGFTEIPAGTKIEAVFNSVRIYKVDGIRIEEPTAESFADLSYQSSEFSFSFGNSINSLFRNICGDDYVDDEFAWEKEKKVKPPYFIVHFRIDEPYFCSSGYMKRKEDKLYTYGCFTDAKWALKDIEKKIVPHLISSLTVQLSRIHGSTQFRLMECLVYGETSKGETLFDMQFEFFASGTKVKAISPKEIKDTINDSIEQYLKFEPRVGSLFYLGLSEKDRFKKFLIYFQALEIYTHKTFNQIDFGKHIYEISPPPIRLEETARQFYIERQSESKNLNQRFMWCAILKWNNLDDSDVLKFKEIKKHRDELSHGENISESDLPVEDLENLLLKIL